MQTTEVSSVQFTVGKMDAGVAILLSPDHHIIEFPTTILPDDIKPGHIVNISVERNVDEEQRQLQEFNLLQEVQSAHVGNVPDLFSGLTSSYLG
jgi:chitin biosynthesis protein CHS5